MDRLNVKTKALMKYSVLLTALTCIHFTAEYIHYRLCAPNFTVFVMSSGSPMCQGIKGISALTMEKLITYVS
jgi:hypothetical protein